MAAIKKLTRTWFQQRFNHINVFFIYNHLIDTAIMVNSFWRVPALVGPFYAEIECDVNVVKVLSWLKYINTMTRLHKNN